VFLRKQTNSFLPSTELGVGRMDYLRNMKLELND
jgi:hypothetical protein